jgi:hypothetical protein
VIWFAAFEEAGKGILAANGSRPDRSQRDSVPLLWDRPGTCYISIIENLA